jgi:predicted dehydrogenase
MNDIGVGLLGITHPHTSGRLKALLSQPGVAIRGAADDHPVVVPFAAHFEIQRRRTDEILADPAIDAVLIHSKSQEMQTLAAAALRAGKAVLVEKPAGRSVADLDLLASTVAETGGICQVGYNFRFSQAVEKTDAVLEAQLLGDVVQARAHGACSLDEAATSHLNQPDDMGGALWVIGCHIVDLLLHHFGMPDVVNARVPKFDGLRDPAFREDAASATLTYRDKLIALDFMSWDPLPWQESWELSVYGTDGVLHSGVLPAHTRLFLRRPRTGQQAGWTSWRQTSFPIAWAATPTAYTPELAEIANTELFEREAQAFLAAIRGDAPVVIDVTHARDIARVIEACYASSQAAGAAIALAQSPPDQPEDHDVQDLTRADSI